MFLSVPGVLLRFVPAQKHENDGSDSRYSYHDGDYSTGNDADVGFTSSIISGRDLCFIDKSIQIPVIRIQALHLDRMFAVSRETLDVKHAMVFDRS